MERIKLRCKANYDYEQCLTEGEIYEGFEQEGIFANTPYFTFIGDDGKEHTAHLKRFEKVEVKK